MNPAFIQMQIIHFERNGDVRSENLSTFIEGQKKIHQYASEKMKKFLF